MVNICMTVKDRPRHTDQALRSLYRNTDVSGFNLTIVDDGSKSETRELLQEFKQSAGASFPLRPAIQLLHLTESYGVGGNKNLAVKMSETAFGRGDYLYLSDNDVYFCEDWLPVLTGLYEILSGKAVAILGGQNHPFLRPNKLIWRTGMRSVHSHDAVAGCSWLMSWKIWDKYGPLMDNAKGVRQSEDWKFCNDAVKDGWLVAAVTPPVVIDCGKTDTFGELVPGSEHYQEVKGVWRG